VTARVLYVVDASEAGRGRLRSRGGQIGQRGGGGGLGGGARAGVAAAWIGYVGRSRAEWLPRPLPPVGVPRS